MWAEEWNENIFSMVFAWGCLWFRLRLSSNWWQCLICLPQETSTLRNLSSTPCYGDDADKEREKVSWTFDLPRRFSFLSHVTRFQWIRKRYQMNKSIIIFLLSSLFFLILLAFFSRQFISGIVEHIHSLVIDCVLPPVSWDYSSNITRRSAAGKICALHDDFRYV